MAQLIATVSLCIFIVGLQHLYNWVVRKIWDVFDIDGVPVLFVFATFINIVVTYFLFGTLIEINK